MVSFCQVPAKLVLFVFNVLTRTLLAGQVVVRMTPYSAVCMFQIMAIRVFDMHIHRQSLPELVVVERVEQRFLGRLVGVTGWLERLTLQSERR